MTESRRPRPPLRRVIAEAAAVSVSFRYPDCIVAVTDEGVVHASLDGDYPN